MNLFKFHFCKTKRWKYSRIENVNNEREIRERAGGGKWKNEWKKRNLKAYFDGGPFWGPLGWVGLQQATGLLQYLKILSGWIYNIDKEERTGYKNLIKE